MFMLSLVLMAASVLPSPAQDAPAAVVPPDHADVEQQRRAVQVERDQRARYDAPPVEDYARQKTEMMRAFFIDGYGHDVGLVTVTRAPAQEPRIEWRAPKPREGEGAVSVMNAIVPLSLWRDLQGASGYFDRALVQRPTKQHVICLHGWGTRVEMVDDNGKIRHATADGCGDDSLAWPFAKRMAATALATMPTCALLNAERAGNDIMQLGKCTVLAGDRAAAAEAYNAYDTPWFANPRGEDFARSLTYLFLEKLDFSWPGETPATQGAAAARLWSIHAGENFFSPQRVFGETADRVRMEGVIWVRGATPEANPKATAATMIWERCNGFGFRVARFWVGRAGSHPMTKTTSCSRMP